MKSDEIKEADVLACLDRAKLKHQNHHRYIVSQCPLHQDKNPSTQIFKDDWFAVCHSGCGRFHITKAFPVLRGWQETDRSYQKKAPKMTAYKRFDLLTAATSLPNIPRGHIFKNLPIEALDELGWRYTANEIGMGVGYFIPYYSPQRKTIPFAQVRHLSGERRFTFLKDAEPTLYGLWNLDNPVLFLVEGPSDLAVLEYCAVPCVAVPSSSFGGLAVKLSIYCTKNAIQLVYGGDNDLAGDKLRQALDEAGASYRVCQPPKKYKDWGDFFVAEGIEPVYDWCERFLWE
jgi:hypothetical protein